MATFKGVVPGGKYTFNATAGTITFDPDYTGIVLSDIMLITNVKSGTAVTIYDPFDTTKGGSLTGLVLTLAFSTTSMASGDTLQIIVGMVNLPSPIIQTASSTIGGVVCGSGLTPPANPSGCGSSTGNNGADGNSIPIVTSPAQIYGWYFYNPNSVAAYVKIWNTAGTITSSGNILYLVCVLVIPPVGGANAFGIGITCSSGIAITITQGRNIATAMPSAIDYNIFYKS